MGQANTVGERIKLVREELGWTQDKLAAKAKMSKSFISDVERGERDISSAYLLRIANAMGASLEFLMRGEDTPLRREDITVPPELSQAAEQQGWRWNETLSLIRAHNSIIARRTNTAPKQPSVQGWIELYNVLKKHFDGETGE
jgi:transcriptional regulator with XRE-family HTH domain